MKKIQPYLLTLLVTMLLFQDMAADTRNRRIQQGYVRTQSFFNKKSEPLPDVMIILDDEQLNRSTAGGYFEINLDNHEDTFRIDSVFYPKDQNIRLLSSIMMREYVFSETNPVILIMMDEKELERQIEYATEGAIASIKEKNKSKSVISLKRKKINLINPSVNGSFMNFSNKFISKTIKNKNEQKSRKGLNISDDFYIRKSKGEALLNNNNTNNNLSERIALNRNNYINMKNSLLNGDNNMEGPEEYHFVLVKILQKQKREMVIMDKY
jgi:hypothetical protein